MLSAKTFQSYGWSLFLGLPFSLGLVSSYLHSIRVPRPLGQCLLVTFLSLVTSGAALLGCAMEGLGCIVMFLPLALPMSMIGRLLGYSLQRRPMPAPPHPNPL